MHAMARGVAKVINSVPPNPGYMVLDTRIPSFVKALMASWLTKLVRSDGNLRLSIVRLERWSAVGFLLDSQSYLRQDTMYFPTWTSCVRTNLFIRGPRWKSLVHTSHLTWTCTTSTCSTLRVQVALIISYVTSLWRVHRHQGSCSPHSSSSKSLPASGRSVAV